MGNERNPRNKTKTDRTPAGVPESSAAPAGADRIDAHIRGLAPPANFCRPSGTDRELRSKEPGHEFSIAQRGDCAFTRDGETLASFRSGEEARANAVEEMRASEAGNRRVFILSGNRRAKVEAMADRLGIARERCRGEMSPEEKAEWIERFDAHDTLYIGDGANDSLAFDAAWCSGTPAVDRGLLAQKADFYFLGRGRGRGGVRALLATGATRRRVCRAVVAFAIALSLAGKMNPLLAAVLMPASSLVSLAIVVIGLSWTMRGKVSR